MVPNRPKADEAWLNRNFRFRPCRPLGGSREKAERLTDEGVGVLDFNRFRPRA
jgi:hypothetical protein